MLLAASTSQALHCGQYALHRACLHPVCSKPLTTKCLGRSKWSEQGIHGGLQCFLHKSCHDSKDITCHGLLADGLSMNDDITEKEGWTWEWRSQMMAKILLFALPALAIPLADPLLSVVDTLCISQCSGTVELAALAPNMAIFNFANYTFNSLGIATITIAADLLKQKKDKEASTIVSTALFIALVCGVASMLGLQAFGKPLIAATGVDPVVAGHATKYLLIRALAQPAALCIVVCQAALLAQKDSVTPFATVALACIINVLGDVLLITKFGMGVAGAAAATVLAEYCEVGVMLAVLETSGRIRPRFILPSLERIKHLLFVWLPLVVDYICKGACYLSIQWAAAGLRTLEVAAHQVMHVWWNMMAFCHGPVKDSALAFIPAAQSAPERVQLSYLIMAFGIAMGIGTGAMAGMFPYALPSFFTPDQLLWPLMRSICSFSLLSILFCGVDCAMLGVLYANGDSAFVARTMAVNLVMIIGYLSVAKQMSWGLQGIWGGIAFFFLMRMLWTTSRVFTEHMDPKRHTVGQKTKSS